MKKMIMASVAALAVATFAIGGAFAFGNETDEASESQVPPDRTVVKAPIDGADVRILESHPPQYVLNIQAGLPSGCAEEYGYKVTRVGNFIDVTVLNTMPSDPNTPCTMIYGNYELNINLGSDFESGQVYTAQVNDRLVTFVAQ